LTWKVHKAKENPKKTILVSLFLFALLLFFFIFYGLFWTILAFLFLFITLNSYFLPIRYILTEEEIIIDRKIFRSKRAWKVFRRIVPTKVGVVLSPFAQGSFLDNFRGIHIFLPEEKEEIIRFIEEKIKPKDQ